MFLKKIKTNFLLLLILSVFIPIKANAYSDVIPFDESIVDNDSYINASWILDKKYILTQDPLHYDIDNFWTMILKYKIGLIVKLVNSSNYFISREKSSSIVFIF